MPPALSRAPSCTHAPRGRCYRANPCPYVRSRTRRHSAVTPRIRTRTLARVLHSRHRRSLGSGHTTARAHTRGARIFGLARRTLPGRYSLGRYADPWPWHPRLLHRMAAFTGQQHHICTCARTRLYSHGPRSTSAFACTRSFVTEHMLTSPRPPLTRRRTMTHLPNSERLAPPTLVPRWMGWACASVA